MSPRIEVEPFQPRQLPRIVAIERASFGRDAYPPDLLRELYQDCGNLFLVAKRSGRIAGYIVSCREDRQAELVSIAVDPRFRTAGIGSALLRATLARLRRARTQRFGLMVKTDNQAAIAFYEKFGFIRARRVRRYYEDRRDAWLMFFGPFEKTLE